MNEDLKKLKEKVRRINLEVDAGNSIQLNMSEGAKTAKPLLINENKILEAKNKSLGSKEEVSNTKMRGGDDRFENDTSEDFDIDFNEIQLTDEDVHEIIKNAPQDTRMRSEGSAPVPIVNVTYDARAKTWILTSDCVYTTENGWTITAKKDFAFDLASVPRFFWAIISSFDLSLIAPLYHDLLYRHGGLLPAGQLAPEKNPPFRFEREEADKILYELMKKAGVSWWKRQAAYRAVRTFSGFAWKD